MEGWRVEKVEGWKNGGLEEWEEWEGWKIGKGEEGIKIEKA